jgi:hypothetical protein
MSGGFGAGVPDGLISEVLAFEQPRAHRHIAIFTALALPNMDDHALAVDVLVDKFAALHARGVQGHEDGPRLEIAGRLDQARHFVRTQHARRSVVRVLGVGYGVG